MNPHALIRRCLSAVAALALSAGAFAVAAPGATAQEDDTDSLRIATNQEVDTFNPFKRRFVITYETSMMTYETLVRMSAENYEPVPGLATEWEESPDGLTWTFKIREGATWSDGEPLTAKDVAYTYGLLIENQAIHDWNIDFAANLVSAEAPDDSTFVLTLAEPAPAEVLSREVYIVPEHIWSQYPDPSADDANQLPLVGSGPVPGGRVPDRRVHPARRQRGVLGGRARLRRGRLHLLPRDGRGRGRARGGRGRHRRQRHAGRAQPGPDRGARLAGACDHQRRAGPQVRLAHHQPRHGHAGRHRVRRRPPRAQGPGGAPGAAHRDRQAGARGHRARRQRHPRDLADPLDLRAVALGRRRSARQVRPRRGEPAARRGRLRARRRRHPDRCPAAASR